MGPKNLGGFCWAIGRLQVHTSVRQWPLEPTRVLISCGCFITALNWDRLELAEKLPNYPRYSATFLIQVARSAAAYLDAVAGTRAEGAQLSIQ